MAMGRTSRRVRWVGFVAGVLACAGVGVEAARTPARKAERPAPPLKTRDAQLIELGRRLFFDPALSAFGEKSCASCHDPQHGFSDPEKRSLDDDGLTPRHSQALIDVDVSMAMHWDGAIADLPTTTRGRMDGPTGAPYYGEAVTTLPATLTSAFARIDGGLQVPDAVRELGTVAAVSRSGPFPTAAMMDFPGETRIQQRYANVLETHRHLETVKDVCTAAVAAYVQSLRSSTSAYDRFAAGEEGALSPEARRGHDLFKGRAGCADCHKTDAPAEWASFRDGKYHNTGVAWLGRPPSDLGRRLFPFTDDTDFPPEFETALDLVGQGDQGRGAVDAQPLHKRAFKTPTLRDVARHPPYMHDGSLATLEEVVRHYASGCGDDAERDSRVRGFEASETDVADLVAFLGALTSEKRPGVAERAWGRRAQTTRLQFVSAAEKPLAGLTVAFTPAGDVASGKADRAAPFVRTTDEYGRLSFPVTTYTHVRMELPGGLTVRGGDWVPDTCRDAKLVVPVAGTARLAFLAPPDLDLPETINLWRIAGPQVATSTQLVTAPGVTLRRGLLPTATRQVWPVNPEPWCFTRQGVVDLAGKRTALYTGWCPNDGRNMLFRLEGQRAAQQVTLEPDTTVRVEVAR
jgi:cytochrome c peroxidase